MELNEMYRDLVMDHAKDPRNFGPLDGSVVQIEGFNPLCGDLIRVGIFGSERVDRVKFQGEGCSICMASASMMTEELEGATYDLALEKIQGFRDLMQAKECPLKWEGDVMALSGVRAFPVRIKCALLAWTTAKDAVEKAKSSAQKGDSK